MVLKFLILSILLQSLYQTRNMNHNEFIIKDIYYKLTY